jgi:lipopolysaccharide/colanic/teichoic acid biosynthesis glycosyltransferase
MQLERMQANIKVAKDAIDCLLERKKTQLLIKRLFDITASLAGIIVLAPLLVLIAVAIKADSEGEVLFKQTRVGRNEVPFKILKFRTMIKDAEKKGMQLTVGRDSRITRIGCFLRKAKLDELPQLLNVLKGDMSFVGPRPEVPKYTELYSEEQQQILKLRPGITDPASIQYRNENEILVQCDDPEKMYIEEIMPAKIALNMKYMRKISLSYDIRLIIKTIILLIRR